MSCHLMSGAWHAQCWWHVQRKFAVFGRFSRFKLVLKMWSTLGGVTNAVLQKNVPARRYIENTGFLLAITCCKSIGETRYWQKTHFVSITPRYRQTPGVNTDKNYTAEKPIQFWTVPTHHLFILANQNFKIKAIINHCNAYFSRCIIFALKISKIQRPMPSVNIFTKKHASYRMRLRSMDSPGEWMKIPRQ